MSEQQVEIFARKLKDLNVPMDIGTDPNAFSQVKIATGNMPEGFSSFEGLYLNHIIQILSKISDKYFEPMQQEEFELRLAELMADFQAKADDIVAQGFYLGFTNEAAMRAYTPSFAETRAKLDDTKKVYRWERTSAEGVTPITGIWHDTGLSELDQAINYTNKKISNTVNPIAKTIFSTLKESLFKSSIYHVVRDSMFSYTFESTSLTDMQNISISLDNNLMLLDTLLPNELLENGKKTTTWKEVALSKLTVSEVITTESTSTIRVVFSETISDAILNSARKCVFDKSSVFTARTLVDESDIGSKQVFMSGTRNIQIILPISELSFDYSVAAVQSHLRQHYANIILNVLTETKYTLLTHINYVLAQRDTILNLDISAFITAKVDVYITDTKYVDAITTFDNRKVTEIVNQSSYDYSNFPIELKVDFEQPICKENSDLVVIDTAGNEYFAQFSPASYANKRFDASAGFYACGSFKTGSIFFNGNATVSAKSKYRLFVKTNLIRRVTPVPELIESFFGTAYSLYFGNYIYNFSRAAGFSLSSIQNSDRTKTQVITTQYRSITYNAATEQTTEVNNTIGESLKVLSAGDVFIDVEQISYNVAAANFAEKTLKYRTVYRIFKNGMIQIMTRTNAQSYIAKNVLISNFLQISANASSLQVDVSSGAAISQPTPFNGKNLSLSATLANGDSHREGILYGPLREAVARPSYQAPNLRLIVGFTDAVDSATQLRYGVQKNWAWTAEAWINLEETSVTAFDAVNRLHQRPVGFLYNSHAPYLLKNKIAKKCLEIGGSLSEWWMSDDSTSYKESEKFKGAYYDAWLYRLAIDMPNFNNLSSLHAEFKASVGDYSLFASRWQTANIGAAQDYWILYLGFEYLYKAAIKSNNQLVINDVRSGITSLANVMLNHAIDNDYYIGLSGQQPGKSSANTQAIGMYALALAIYAECDVDDAYLNAYERCEQVFFVAPANTYFPIINDSLLLNTPLSTRHYLIYEAVTTHAYTKACKLLNRVPIFDMTSKFLKAIDGTGRFDEISWCISESRRGGVNTAFYVMQQFMYSNDLSSLAAAWKSLDQYEEDWTLDMTQAYSFDDYRYLDKESTIVRAVESVVWLRAAQAAIMIYLEHVL